MRKPISNIIAHNGLGGTTEPIQTPIPEHKLPPTFAWEFLSVRTVIGFFAQRPKRKILENKKVGLVPILSQVLNLLLLQIFVVVYVKAL